MAEKHSTPRKGTTTRTRQPKDWQCQECGRTMTLKQAERASSVGCPGCGGTDVDLKVEFAPPIDKRRPARPARPRPRPTEKATSTGRLRKLPLARIYPNPDQPRKEFKEAELYELAASIKTHGLLQPIRVRPDGHGRYMVIAGERRYRAHLLAGLTEISTHVDDVDDVTVMEHSIVENLQRVDITPLEEARAFQTCLEMSVGCHGEGDPVALAQRLGLKQPWRITERLSLLNLREDHQDLLARGILTPSQAYEMSRLPPPLQDELLKLIRKGACDSYARLRATTEGLLLRESQGELLPPADPVTAEEQEALTGLERLVEKLCSLLARSFDNKQIVIVKKIRPYRAGIVADQIKLIGKHLGKMEKALRAQSVAAVQVEAAA